MLRLAVSQGNRGSHTAKDLLKIIDVGEQLDYEQCIVVSMRASLNEMSASKALVIVSSLIIDGNGQLGGGRCISMLDISHHAVWE